MLLSKKIKLLFPVIILLFSVLLVLSIGQSVPNKKTCDISDIKEGLRRALFEHFTSPTDTQLDLNEIKDLLHFYLSTNTSQITIDCSDFGPFSGKPYYLMLGVAKNIQKNIPRCGDGTQYGKCSSRGSRFCYGGKIVERCTLCGCPANERCDNSTNKCIADIPITCNINQDCGTDTYIGNYLCINNSVYRNYTMNTCYNASTVYSGCAKTVSTVLVDSCGIGTYCVDGQSTCQKTVTDLAPSVAISIAPKNVIAGQPFNITVFGTDDIGLSSIWWFGVNTSDSSLNMAHMYNCNNQTYCKNTWIVSTNAIGTLTFGANSRDTSYPKAGEPHQASEGAGFAYDTVTVTSAITKTNVRCSLDHFYSLPNDVTCTATYNSQTGTCTIIAKNSWGHICDPLPLIMIDQPQPNIGFMPVPGLSAVFSGIKCSKIETSYNTNYYFINCIGPYNNHTLEGDDGSWCLDSDGNGGYFTKGYCQDKNGTYTDFCSTNTARDYYCTGTWTGSAWHNVKCEHGGYDCASGGYSCVDGACTNQTVIATLTIKGRLIDYFTKNPISNALVYTWDGQTRRDVYTSTNGEFAITANATSITQTSPKPFGINPSCYDGMGFAIFRNADGSLYVNVQLHNLIGPAKAFQVTGSEVNIGDVPMWPAVDIALFSDIPVYFRILYNGFVGSGNLLYKTYHYLSYSVPLNASVTIKTTDAANTSYTSPQINLPRDWGCTIVKLNFSSKQFNWIVPQTTMPQTNQTSCTDSDNGKNYYTKGTTIDQYNTFTDQCLIVNRDSNGNFLSYTNTYNCDSTQYECAVQEYSCYTWPDGNITAANNVVVCISGCQDGACLSQTNQSKLLRVTSPNGGETWYYNKTYNVQYKFSGISQLGFEIKKGTQVVYSLAPITVAAAVFSHYLNPNQLSAIGTGSDYKIKLYDYNNPSLFDESDATFSIQSTAQIINLTNQTTCTEVSKSADFENPPHLSFHLTWNPDLGTQSSYNYNLDETARNWLRAQGIEITGTPNGIVWGTGISGPVGKTGVIIGDASPSFLENDQGISDNEVLTVRFLNNSVKSVTVTLTSTPSNAVSINNIPATVIMDAYNSAGSLVVSSTKTFTGVTNGVYTPTTMNVSSTSFNIAKITLRTTRHPYGGVWLEDINFKVPCT